MNNRTFESFFLSINFQNIPTLINFKKPIDLLCESGIMVLSQTTEGERMKDKLFNYGLHLANLYGIRVNLKHIEEEAEKLNNSDLENKELEMYKFILYEY